MTPKEFENEPASAAPVRLTQFSDKVKISIDPKILWQQMELLDLEFLFVHGVAGSYKFKDDTVSFGFNYYEQSLDVEIIRNLSNYCNGNVNLYFKLCYYRVLPLQHVLQVSITMPKIWQCNN